MIRVPTRRGVSGLLTAMAAVAEFVPGRPAVVVTLAGLWLVAGVPTLTGRRLAGRFVTGRDTAWLLGTGLALVHALVVALVVNTALPWFGLPHPLTTPVLTIAYTLASAVLLLLDRRATGPSARVRLGIPGLPPGGLTVGLLGLACVVLSVAGAIRLNNGLGSGTSLTALVLIAILLGVALARHRTHGAAVTGAALYLAAAAVLLLTSLRGWYITGHDIQREFLVFQLTEGQHHWAVSSFRNPYNACLGITLLPTALTQLTAVPGIWVFKVLLPLLFALTPVIVYRTSRCVAAKPVALIGAIFFMAFPTFFTDMPFLGRQETAFLLLGCAMLVLADRTGPVRARRWLFVCFVAGIVLTHYSTTYVLLGVLVIGKVLSLLVRRIGPLRRRVDERGPRPALFAPFVTWWVIGAIALAAVLWTGPVTGTGRQVEETAAGTFADLFGNGDRSGSSDTGYSLFGGTHVTPEQRLAEYAKITEAQTRGDQGPGGEYPSESTVDSYPVRVASTPDQPLTTVGRALADAGVPVAKVNGLLRQFCAYALQLLLAVGLIGTLFTRSRGFSPTHDMYVLSAASLVVLGIETVLPQLSVDYGVLRTFQQGLFVFAPFVAVATTWVFTPLRRAASPLAAATALGFFLDLSGAVPAALGGYPAQLNLADAGQYYDIYYVHPQERGAIQWLIDHTGGEAGGDVQSEVQTDRYTFSRSQTLISGRAADDLFPALVRKNSYVFLGYTTVTKGQATVFYGGDLVTYSYPTEFLDRTKNKIYSSDGASVYR